ncbi:ATP-binding protein [Caulobacter segnis]
MPSINLKKFIAEHYKGGVTARDVIREGVTNSIQAGASAITVDLFFDRQPGLFGDDVRNVLDKITITDDGEGFTPENLNYFDEVCTGHKDDIGGKGVGRLAFLKFGNRVEIRSQLASGWSSSTTPPISSWTTFAARRARANRKQRFRSRG